MAPSFQTRSLPHQIGIGGTQVSALKLWLIVIKGIDSSVSKTPHCKRRTEVGQRWLAVAAQTLGLQDGFRAIEGFRQAE